HTARARALPGHDRGRGWRRALRRARQAGERDRVLSARQRRPTGTARRSALSHDRRAHYGASRHGDRGDSRRRPFARPGLADLRRGTARHARTLLLGAVGIYGVMAYGVSLRQREIGVRIALGAQPAQVRRMVSREGVGLAAIGVGIGVLVAIGVTRFLRSLLYDVSPTDPVILVGTCLTLLLVALAASWIPARRAASVDPSEALRSG